MNEFIITFRECLEATLIVGIVYTFLSKTNMHQQLKYLWSAVISSIIASIGVAILLVNISNKMQNNAMAKLFEAIRLSGSPFLCFSNEYGTLRPVTFSVILTTSKIE